jgi:stress-induced morphogen
MPITQQELQHTLQTAFPQATIAIQDLAGDNDHWSATIICPTFQGLNRIARHRLVQTAVAEKNIHALQLTTKTPEE